MKKWIVFGLILAAIVSFGYRVEAAQTELVVAGYGGDFEKIFKDKLAPAFEKKHNVKILFVSGNSTETLARAQAQKNSPQMDVAFLDDGPLMQGAALDLWEPIDTEICTNMKDLYDIAKRKGNLGIDLGVQATGLMYNTEIFKQNGWAPPTSWADLGKKEYAGHLIMPPMTNGFGLLTVVMLARMNGGSETNINPGFEAMEKIKKNFLVFEPQPGKHSELFQSKQAWVGVWGNGRVYTLAETGFPVEFVYPKEGSPGIPMCLTVIKGTKQKKIANEFINYMLGKEAQIILTENFKTGPYNKTVKLKPETAKKVPYGEEQIGKLYKADWEAINKVRPEWTERWNKEIEK
jgi:putative spermidine/putrescine transport system substrate-binding protein